jgi:probable HAF family extracellular repeat protein
VTTIDNQHTFLLDPTQGYIDLGTFGGEFAYATDINNSAQVLVNSYYAGPVLQYGDYEYLGTRTLVYQNGQETPVPDAPSQITYGWAINERGQVAGSFQSIPGRETHAFVWDPATGMTDISGGQNTDATDINNVGTVVGFRTISYPPTQGEAFVYTKATGMQNLIDLIPPNSGWTSLSYATSINDRGQILGVGTQGGSFPLTVFLLTPVPEPPSMIMATVAIAAVVGFRRVREVANYNCTALSFQHVRH